jgi:hypothetical protein
MVVVEASQLGDRPHELVAGLERPGAEGRAGTFAEHSPVPDAGGLMELLRRDPLGHVLNVTALFSRLHRRPLVGMTLGVQDPMLGHACAIEAIRLGRPNVVDRPCLRAVRLHTRE